MEGLPAISTLTDALRLNAMILLNFALRHLVVERATNETLSHPHMKPIAGGKVSQLPRCQETMMIILAAQALVRWPQISVEGRATSTSNGAR